MEAKRVDVAGVFKAYDRCSSDLRVLVVDVRANKEYKKKHLCLSYNIRLSTNGRVLAVSPVCLLCERWQRFATNH